MALWPGLKQLLGWDKNEKVQADLQNFVLPYIDKHKVCRYRRYVAKVVSILEFDL